MDGVFFCVRFKNNDFYRDSGLSHVCQLSQLDNMVHTNYRWFSHSSIEWTGISTGSTWWNVLQLCFFLPSHWLTSREKCNPIFDLSFIRDKRIGIMREICMQLSINQSYLSQVLKLLTWILSCMSNLSECKLVSALLLHLYWGFLYFFKY